MTPKKYYHTVTFTGYTHWILFPENLQCPNCKGESLFNIAPTTCKDCGGHGVPPIPWCEINE